MKEKYLPIGTVVKLKKVDKNVMIIGFCGLNKNDDKVFDYVGCLYPEGILSSNEVSMFNHDQIENVLFNGYINEEEKMFKDNLNNLLKEIEI